MTCLASEPSRGNRQKCESQIITSDLMSNLISLSRILGHKPKVFCYCFRDAIQTWKH